MERGEGLTLEDEGPEKDVIYRNESWGGCSTIPRKLEIGIGKNDRSGRVKKSERQIRFPGVKSKPVTNSSFQHG